MKLEKTARILLFALFASLAITGCKQDPEKQKAAFVSSAEKLVAEEKYSDAIIQYRNALKIDPKSSTINFSLGEAYFRNGQMREAFGAYRKATDLDPNNAKAQLATGRFYLV